jgi:hypothetical protein
MPSDANVIIILPMPWLKKGSWLERLYEELLHTGVLADVKEATGTDVDEDLIYHVIDWRCTGNNENMCPAIIVTLSNEVYLLRISPYADKGFVKIMDFKEVLIEEIEGLLRHSECDLAGYIC